MLTTARHANLAESIINSTYRKGLLTLAVSARRALRLEQRVAVHRRGLWIHIPIGDQPCSQRVTETDSDAFVATTLQWYLGTNPTYDRVL
jgi:hypothetical protein